MALLSHPSYGVRFEAAVAVAAAAAVFSPAAAGTAMKASLRAASEAHATLASVVAREVRGTDDGNGAAKASSKNQQALVVLEI